MGETDNKLSWPIFFVQTIIAAVISAGVIGAMLNLFWIGPEQRSREWKQASLEKVMAPVIMNLNRTKIINQLYIKSRKFGFATILYEGNTKVREILLTNGHLIPDELVEPANRLVAHYDIWIKRYIETIDNRKIKASDTFELGLPDLTFDPYSAFPKDAAEKFHKYYQWLRSELQVN